MKKQSWFERHPIWKWIIIIIFVVLVFNYIFDGNKKEEYTDCVDYCEMDNHECISFLGDVEGYVSYFEAISCADDLEFCIDDCEDDWG